MTIVTTPATDNYKYCTTWAEYAEKAMTTIKTFPEGDERSIAHPFIGLIYEVAEVGDAMKKHIIYEQELDLLALLKEIGDSFWYVAAILSLSQNNNINLAMLEDDAKDHKLVTPNDIYIVAPLILCHQAVGLATHYENKDWESMNKGISQILYTLASLCVVHNVSILEVLNMNLEKLALRYPDKIFTIEASKTRADETPLH